MTILEKIKEECRRNYVEKYACKDCKVKGFCFYEFKNTPYRWEQEEIEEIEKRLSDENNNL